MDLKRRGFQRLACELVAGLVAGVVSFAAHASPQLIMDYSLIDGDTSIHAPHREFVEPSQAMNPVTPALTGAQNPGFADSSWPVAQLWQEYPLRVTPISEFEPRTKEQVSPGTNLLGINSPPFKLAVRPREFTFSELLLNPKIDPQCFLPGLGLHLAVAVRDYRLLERLLQMGADPNALLSQPIPPPLIHLFGDEKAAYYLSKDSGITPLMLATLTKQPLFVRLLLQYGADTERFHTRKFHLYPLDFAAQRGDVPMMQLLLGRGSSVGDPNGRLVVVSLSGQNARLLQGGRSLFATPVSTGKPGYRTPAGEYVVTQKYKVWRSDIYKVPMPNFMRLNCGPIGLHGGYVPDTPASHGCIRLPPESAAALYTIIRVGDRVSIVQ